jgi:nicotinamidase-related amidase
MMNNKALVVIDIQNDITKHYRDIIDNINAAIEWAVAERLRLEKNGNACGSMHVVYIKHNNITAATRTFKPGTKGEELVPEMKVVSDNIFVKTKSNALTSEAFSAFIAANGINEFYVAGADATACVKSTCFNMAKAGFTVHVLSDCITSYDLKKLPGMFAYYESKGCEVKTLADYKQ